MRKLIFGCGYLGRRVAGAWHCAGHDVHVVTRSADRAVEFQSRGWTPHVADICQPDTLANLPTVDTALFCVGYDRESGRSQREVMVDGLANAIDSYRGRCERWVYTSSTSVYAQQLGEWVDETSPCEPKQPGGQCCLAAERLLTSGTVLRLAGLYGPGRLLSRIEALQRGEPLAGNPDAWLNLIHVNDAVAAILAVEERWSVGETYLVCDDRPISRREYFTALAQFVCAPPPRFHESQPSRRGAGGLNKRCSNRKLHERLGLALRFPTIHEGLPASAS